jgi:hypothetical protein
VQYFANSTSDTHKLGFPEGLFYTLFVNITGMRLIIKAKTHSTNFEYRWRHNPEIINKLNLSYIWFSEGRRWILWSNVRPFNHYGKPSGLIYNILINDHYTNGYRGEYHTVLDIINYKISASITLESFGLRSETLAKFFMI